MGQSAKMSKSLGWAGAVVEDYASFYGFVKVTLPASPCFSPP